MKVKAKVIPSGNATAIEVPKRVVEALAGGARPPIRVTINGHSWRTRVALMRGLCLVGISAQHRTAAQIAEGDTVDATIELDDQPREVTEPADLKAALNAKRAAREAFTRLAFGLRQKHVRLVEEAKAPETRARRIAKLIADLLANAD